MLNLTIPKVERPTQRELATTFMYDILGGSNWHVVIDKDYPGVPRLMCNTFLSRYYIRKTKTGIP